MVLSHYDVIIIGGGNAAIVAAIEAREMGAKVAIIEAAPYAYRGGNSRHTRNFRVKHNAPLGQLEDNYKKEEFLEDLLKVTKGKTDIRLANIMIDKSDDCYKWMEQRNVKFQPSLSGTLSLARTNAFFLGGGKALLNNYYNYAKKIGVDAYYKAEAIDFTTNKQLVTSVTILYQGKNHKISPKAIIVASGGFESNKEWLQEYWGDVAKNFIIRGTQYNKGKALRALINQNILTVGEGKQCHAVAVDGQAPEYDGGIATRLDCVPFSVTVNQLGKRFYDEGEDLWPKRYAVWGRLVAEQPNQIAYAIIDAKAINDFMPPLFDPITASTIEELAYKSHLPKHDLVNEINSYNAACNGNTHFNAQLLDNLATINLNINKTNWARKIDTPPYYAFVLKTGITFTYLGLKVNEKAQCVNHAGLIDNLWAAGEIMAGSILGEGYLAGTGMTIGTVFGRIAGKEAANYANSK